jgi:hypothetical protein
MDIPGFINSVITSDAFATLVLTAFAGAVSAAVGAIAYFVRKRILKDLDAADLAQLRDIAALAVQYAEQKFKDAGGEEKLAAALQAADALIASYGIHVTTSQLRTIIEAAVYAELAEPASVEGTPA